MNRARTAFTIVEVIFVIVILGILASVAIPKLAITKLDATAARIALELGDCIEMASGAYTMDGSFDLNSFACNDVQNSSMCFILIANDSNGSLNVKHVADALDGSVCKKAQELVELNKLSSATGVNHSF
jgi:prepilin-type N-terminal cleavage/methylation domain-containing protein